MLDRIGAPVRRGGEVALSVVALGAGTLGEAVRPGTWRRPVRDEFRRCLRQALAGNLGTTLLVAAPVGLGVVYQAFHWLGMVGQTGMVGGILAAVLVREGAPVLVGFVLLGRDGAVTVLTFGRMVTTGHPRVLEGDGQDPFRRLVLPRVLAAALAGVALGLLFVAAALATGWAAGVLLGALPASGAEVFGGVIGALRRRDFVLVPAKLLLVGALVALTAAVTGLSATPQDEPTYLLPRAFVRGAVAVLASSAALSAAAG